VVALPWRTWPIAHPSQHASAYHHTPQDRTSNILRGNGGNDWVSGLAGNDTLSGNEGADTFVFISTTASTPTSPDTIQDFVAGTDRIDLRTIDANATLLSNQAFVYIDDASFTGTAGQLNFINGVLSGDVDGDAVPDLQVKVAGSTSLQAMDFLL
jgi:serralysin